MTATFDNSDGNVDTKDNDSDILTTVMVMLTLKTLTETLNNDGKTNQD